MMLHRFTASIWRTLVAAALCFVAACGDSTPNAPLAHTAPVRVALDVLPLTHTGVAVDSAVLNVSASDISGVGHWVLPGIAGHDTLSATLNLPVGTARVIDVAVYAGGSEVGFGTGFVDVAEGSNPPFTINVYAVQGGPASPTGYGTVPVNVTTTLFVPTITPKIDTLAVGDTVRFRLLDPNGKPVADPANFPPTWSYSTTQYIPSVKGVGLITWTAPGSLCGYIDASGLYRALQSGCDVKIVGTIGSVSDTARVHIR